MRMPRPVQSLSSIARTPRRINVEQNSLDVSIALDEALGEGDLVFDDAKARGAVLVVLIVLA